jgi:hypothetical protein
LRSSALRPRRRYDVITFDIISTTHRDLVRKSDLLPPGNLDERADTLSNPLRHPVFNNRRRADDSKSAFI